MSWPLPLDWDEQQLQEALSGRARAVATRRKNHAPDFAAIRLQLQSHRNLTLQLLWEEYRQGTPDGYSYSRYVVAKIMLRLRKWAREAGAFPAQFRT